ncbi:MAG TPA: hypothetical protein VKZ68_09395 [Ohtaekwangia sp.]|nr:hypothetical protein [Ohtaekwangia sp.]
MIHVVQLIYLHEGCEKEFLEFEDHVLPLIDHFRGVLELRLRPSKSAWITGSRECPYEIHWVSFPGDQELRDYVNSPERLKWLELKEKSVRVSIQIKGELV